MTNSPWVSCTEKLERRIDFGSTQPYMAVAQTIVHLTFQEPVGTKVMNELKALIPRVGIFRRAYRKVSIIQEVDRRVVVTFWGSRPCTTRTVFLTNLHVFYADQALSAHS